MIKAPDTVTDAWLWEMDLLRLDRPKSVLKVLDLAVDDTPDELLPLFYAVYGAAFRQMDFLCEARWSYQLGKEIAEEHHREDMVGLIIHRGAWVDAAEGQFSGAVSKMRCAAGIFTELGDNRNLGKTLVDRGALFHHLGRFSYSSCCMEKGLPLLDRFDYENRFSANHVCALNSYSLGYPEAALKWIKKARKDLPYCSEQARECYRWLNAQCLVDAGDYLKGAEEFGKISEFSREKDSLTDAALAKAEQARALLKARNYTKAEQVALSMNWFVFRLNSKIAQAALIDLRRTAAEGELAHGLDVAIRSLGKIRKTFSGHPPKSG